MYGGFGLIGWVPFWRKRGLWVIAFLVGLVILPLIFVLQTRVQVTVFDTREMPVIVAQRPGQTTAIAATDPAQTERLLTPFFAKQGINQPDCEMIANQK